MSGLGSTPDLGQKGLHSRRPRNHRLSGRSGIKALSPTTQESFVLLSLNGLGLRPGPGLGGDNNMLMHRLLLKGRGPMGTGLAQKARHTIVRRTIVATSRAFGGGLSHRMNRLAPPLDSATLACHVRIVIAELAVNYSAVIPNSCHSMVMSR